MSDFDTDRLKLPNPGDVVSLVVEAAKHQYRVTWLGFAFRHSVMVTAPRSGGSLMPVYINDLIAIRYLKDNHVHGFKAAVLDYHRSPYPYLHLAYPEAIAEHRIRGAHRVVTRLEGHVLVGAGGEEAVEIMDLSGSGARICVGRDDIPLDSALTLRLHVAFAGSEAKLDIPCVVKNMLRREDVDEGRTSYGLAFRELERMDRIMLSGYIYEQLSKQRTNL